VALDFFRLDVLSSGDEHVVLPPQHDEIAALVQCPEVSGVVPAIRIERTVPEVVSASEEAPGGVVVICDAISVDP
jgi:hypothetical protein